MTAHHGTHSDLRSEQGPLRGEHPGPRGQPDDQGSGSGLAGVPKPDLAGSERFAHAFGFTTVSPDGG